jgi:hypothetical protein
LDVLLGEGSKPVSVKPETKIHLVEDETQTVLEWAAAVAQSDDTYFQRGQRLAAASVPTTAATG